MCQVIESKRKDANSSGDYSTTDAVRVSVLVCNLSHFLHIELYRICFFYFLYVILCCVEVELGRFSWIRKDC